jgi:pyrimidine deaminase RibD-like protein
MSGTGHEERWMARAIELARLGLETVAPNPAVGAVVVSASELVGEGYHERAGGPHAEVVALEAAGAKAQGADLYVTLEPCSSWGRTPPCVDAIRRAGISKVYIGCSDPNPQHAGRGARILRRLGVTVTEGLLESECATINPDFNRRMKDVPPGVHLIWSGGQTGVDRVALDWAMDHGISHGGWCPQGRLAEDGRIPDRYHLRETPAETYEERTRWNVEDSDATLIFCGSEPLSGGTAFTQVCAQEANKPVLVLTQKGEADRAGERLGRWLSECQPAVLNVAGPRASECKDLEPWVKASLNEITRQPKTAG